MNTPKAAGTRQQLLAAANAVVLEHGATALTLDAVARHAGVSKGGLLYHFPSKEGLVVAMIQQMMEEFEQLLDHEYRSDPAEERPGRWLRAYVRATFAGDAQTFSINAAVLAGVALNPELLAPVRAHFAAWQQRIENDGVDPALATLVRLAADGWWFAQLLDFAPPNAALRTQLRAQLNALTEA